MPIIEYYIDENMIEEDDEMENDLKIVDEIAITNNISVIYVTCKKNNEKFIRFIKNNNFKLYNELDDELIYVKEMKWIQFYCL